MQQELTAHSQPPQNALCLFRLSDVAIYLPLSQLCIAVGELHKVTYRARDTNLPAALSSFHFRQPAVPLDKSVPSMAANIALSTLIVLVISP